jgi:hypothetical protein
VKILIEQNLENGVPLESVKFGQVVRTPRGGDTHYLVVSTMDGTGHRALVSLASGTLKHQADQSVRVIPLNATLVVHGIDFAHE